MVNLFSATPILVLLLTLLPTLAMGADFRVTPYLQNPTTSAATIIWFSNNSAPGQLSYREQGTDRDTALVSPPERADALSYSTWEDTTFFSSAAPSAPYRHRLRLQNLQPATTYSYSVQQGNSLFSSHFTTAPTADQPIRFIVYADSETEPESTGKHTKWTSPDDDERTYLLDQTSGYANNLKVIEARQPNFIAIAGDLVESGGEQRDWDEFWRHITAEDGQQSLASRVPFLAAPGNHEYYEGPQLDRYEQPGSERAIGRFRSYFEFADNGATDPQQHNRYYRFDYGPVALIALDVANDNPHQSARDTNFFLLGEDEEGGGRAPAFGPGSEQYRWLEAQLKDARDTRKFTFVFFHHVPYSVGPHGWPPGEGPGFDTQSGVPVRTLTPLFLRYGVDAVLAGHDEMWERSEISGKKLTASGKLLPHTVQFYDVGIGGDGLRGPQEGLQNPQQKFLVHTHAPEVWRNGVLVEGGKHYGHLEVDIERLTNGTWQAVLKPVYVFPLFAEDGTYLSSERRLYDDVITLRAP